MEPKDLSFTEAQYTTKNVVVKIIYEHWNAMPNLRLGLVSNETKLKFDKVIFIVRDPRDCLISRLFYGVYTALLSDDSEQNVEKAKEWVAFIQEKERDPRIVSCYEAFDKSNKLFGYRWNINNFIAIFSKYTEFLKQNKKSAFILRYEDFIDRNLKSLEGYLGFPLSVNDSVGVKYSRTVRTKSYGNWKEFFTCEDVVRLKTPENQQLLAQYGYDEWVLSENPHLAPQNGSEYIKKLIVEVNEAKERRDSKQPKRQGLFGQIKDQAVRFRKRQQ